MPQSTIWPINPSEIPSLKFEGVPRFTPNYTPRDIMLLGAFNGQFFLEVTSRKGIPTQFFEDMADEQYACYTPDGRSNFFQVEVDRRNRGDVPMIAKMTDPLGWYQWYIRFYYGRRVAGIDGYRINQWRNEICTLFHYIKFGTPINLIDPNLPYEGDKMLDIAQFPKFRQQLLHFGWDSRLDPLTFGIRL